jgi:glycosyltransferase involved in cell wall biosynthesis
MAEKPIGPASDRAGGKQILFLTLAEVDDRSFGGAMRSNDIRGALQQVGNVDTLVIHGANRFALDADWDHERVKRATFTHQGVSLSALDQRRRIRSWVANTLDARRYDVIVARYLGLALFVRFRHWHRLVLDADDIFKTAPASGSAARGTRLKFGVRNAVAAGLLRLAGRVWVVNPLDATRLRSRRVSALPNAVSLPTLDPARTPPVAGRILMVGYFEHPPNAEGLMWFATRILPTLVARFPGVELHAIGKHAPHFAERFSGRVTVRGFVADLAKEYAQAALVIAPIRSGGGTQIKVLEALAHARPLVSSAFAHAGFAEHLVDGEHLLAATSEQDWLRACGWVLENTALSEVLALGGQGAVRNTYGTENMVAAIERTVNELTGNDVRVAA